jgi:diguanylate cyclase (GGDEF)-like protein
MVFSLMSVVWIAYATVPILWISLGLFKPDDLNIPLMVLALATSLLVLVRSIGDSRRFRTKDWDGFNANLSFLQGVIALVACTMAVLSTHVQSGIYRPLLLLILMPLAVMGDRRMAFASWVAYLISITVIAVVLFDSIADIGRMIVVDGLVAGVIVVMVALLMERATGSHTKDEALASMATVLGESHDLTSGMDAAIGELASALVAERVCVLVGPFTTIPEPIASWPGDGESIALDADAIRRASAAGQVQHVDDVYYVAPSRSGGAGSSGSAGSSGAVDVVLAVVCRNRRWWHEPLVESTAVTATVLIAGFAERTAMVERLADMAHTDDMTGVPNRRSLLERFEQEIARARRDHVAFCVGIFDLDHFKRFNDSYGHLAGDRMLKAFTSTITERLRGQDFFARMGGEEFCIVLPGTAVGGAVHLLDELREQAAGLLFDASGQPVTFSVGVAEWQPGEDVSTVLRRADLALYDAKAAGRNRVVAAGVELRRHR